MIASGSRLSQYVKAEVEENPIVSLTNNLSRISLRYKWIVDKHSELCPAPASLPRQFSTHCSATNYRNRNSSAHRSEEWNFHFRGIVFIAAAKDNKCRKM